MSRFKYIEQDEDGCWRFVGSGRQVSIFLKDLESGLDFLKTIGALGFSRVDAHKVMHEIYELLDRGPERYKSRFDVLEFDPELKRWRLSEKDEHGTIQLSEICMNLECESSLEQQAQTYKFSDKYMRAVFYEILCLLDGVKP